MFTIIGVLILAAAVISILSAVRAWPLWPAVLLLSLVEAIKYFPAGSLH